MKLFEKFSKTTRNLSHQIYTHYRQLSIQTQRQLLMAAGVLLVCISITTWIEPFPNSIASELTPSAYTLPPITTPGVDDPMLTETEYAMLTDFIQMMDSVRLHDPETYELIAKDYTGLVDSVKFVISIYKQTSH